MPDPTDTTLTVVCAWCDEFMHEKPGEGIEGVSHGICADCQKKVMAEYRKNIKAIPVTKDERLEASVEKARKRRRAA